MSFVYTKISSILCHRVLFLLPVSWFSFCFRKHEVHRILLGTQDLFRNPGYFLMNLFQQKKTYQRHRNLFQNSGSSGMQDSRNFFPETRAPGNLFWSPGIPKTFFRNQETLSKTSVTSFHTSLQSSYFSAEQELRCTTEALDVTGCHWMSLVGVQMQA